ncbi:serine hydrolase [Deinococcus deserti]|uniref:Putative beta-lactamase (Penicillinase) n=1 Tax=Deinococcus deserti (strain DSM 17065 / CIP 109153 / LMG 22923 / VCD115) TaxID=546414 RepID=C1CYR0_DEIDV|nr:serine hydrolase [Deinococcus deserti]ACO47090.1 putative beta-lactamase (penicillinase) [Deinococcus deserti VCD115]
MREAFLARARQRGFAGDTGLRICDLDGTELYALNATRTFPAASTIKVPLLIQALQEAQTGRLNLRERVTLEAADRVPGSGILYELGAGLQPSWLDLLTLMVIVSDNTATNLVIARLGPDEINSWLARGGWSSTRLIGRLQLPPEQQNEAQRRGERNRTSAHDQVDLLLRLANGALLDRTHTDLALSILSRQQLRDIIGRRVPRSPTGEHVYRLVSKSGELTGVHHDVGILYTPRPLVIALLSEAGQDPREHPENRDVLALADALWPLLSELGQVVPSGDI